MNAAKMVAEIKKKYPKPVPCAFPPQKTQYCVLGAFCKYLREKDGRSPDGIFEFPTALSTVNFFRDINSDLTEELAGNYASCIVEFNDAGKFKEAWDKLQEALSWEPKLDEDTKDKETIVCQVVAKKLRSKKSKNDFPDL
jgi:hypothetical protein